MIVLVEEEDGSLFTMDIDSSDTILQLKENIHDYTRILPTHQILSFHGSVLDDTRNVEFYSILAYSTIQLTIVNPSPNQGGATRAVQLLMVSPCSETPTMQQADLTESVLQLKQRLEKRLGIPPHVLGVSLSPKHHELLDAKRLYDYGLKDGSHIYIYTKEGSSSSSEAEASANDQSEGSPNADVDSTDEEKGWDSPHHHNAPYPTSRKRLSWAFHQAVAGDVN
ncbi:hypothetical protein Cgig2_020614 [Carnegiea gigantea]|uniref:Ubiquitin-like domain-containing protein n=1 Tax=Carnegiea gigantea TaxID=171969 RepID=A0A9Q1Q8P6_9CARY|nr:hypothetical protein Cgig2_020614 [Carnegiea gigantea]